MDQSHSNNYVRYERGQLNTLGYRVYIKNSLTNEFVSPFHDVPLHCFSAQNDVFNAVIEIPRWSNAKMEINKKEKLNPITQDVKNNKLRFVNNIFPHHGTYYTFINCDNMIYGKQLLIYQTNRYLSLFCI